MGDNRNMPPDDPELDDWASAIDEWDKKLDLPVEKPVVLAAPAPAPVAVAPAPVLAPVRATAAEPTTSPGVPLPPPPLGAVPLPDSPSHDPLMHLFDGDMELPEEAGEALGSLLGADGAAANAPEPAAVEMEAPGELELEASFGDFNDESTRVAPVEEVSALLDNVDALATPAPPSTLPIAAPVGRSQPLAPPVLDPGFAVDVSTRVTSPEEVSALIGQSALPAGGSAAASFDVDFEAEFESSPSHAPASATPPPAAAPRKLVSVPKPAAPPAATDDDFYDDIMIVAGRDEPSNPKPAPLPAAPSLDDELPDILDSPLESLGPIDSSRSSDPDRTPLPIALEAAMGHQRSDPDRTPLPIAHGDEDAPTAPIASDDDPPTSRISRTVAPTRIAAPDALPPALTLPEQAPPQPLDADYLRDQLALLDTERLLSQDAGRAARLAYAAGRVAEKLGDRAAALERYETALEIDPRSTPALRGVRRVRFADGQRDRVAALLDREIESSADAEKHALASMRADLYLALGERDLAREGYQQLAQAEPVELGAALGLVDAAAADGRDEELAPALATLQQALATSTDARLKAAVAVERGRLDENAGRVREAVARFRESLSLDPQSLGAVFGLLRVALRTPPESDDVDALARLAELLPRSPLRVAVERRLGLLRARGGDPASARPALTSGAQDGDELTLRALADLERGEGRTDEAAVALVRVIDLERDAGRRADLLFSLGEQQEQKGNTAQALAAYSRASSEYPEDPRAARAIERTQAAGGDKESALARHLRAADRDAARAPLEWTRAARLLDELGRRDEALARLASALAAQPAFAPAVALAAELHAAAGRPDETAALLQRAADAADDGALGAAWRERAVQWWHRAGRPNEALAALRPLLDGDGALPLRWLEQRVLAGGDATALGESFRVEAESVGEGDRARAAELWFRRGLALSPVDPEGAVESQRRALALDPGAGPAAIELAAHFLRGGTASELPSVYQLRIGAASGRAEAVALSWRQAVSHAVDAGDLPSAQRTFGQLVVLAPNYGPGRDALDHLARRAGDDAQIVEALDRELAAETSPEARFALLMFAGERLEKRLGLLDRAAERYRQALELRPRHPIASLALDRALRAAKNYAALADLALSDLKDAPDARSKVAAYERLAIVDGELRGDAGSALLAYESIMEIDHAHHAAMRVLEKHDLREQRWPELVALYDQMGLTATDPAFAAAVHLDRARLRTRVGGDVPAADLEAAIDHDHQLALFKDPHSRPALRHVLARARAAGDEVQVAELSARLADAVGDDGRTGAVCLTRSAEALVELGRNEDAKARFAAAAQRGVKHLPALVGLLDLALSTGDWAAAVDAAEQAGQSLRAPDAHARSFLLAGALAEEKLGDLPRALGDLRQALAVDHRGPSADEAFERLRKVLLALADYPALAELYRGRFEVETDGTRLVALHLELAKVARDHLNDRESARAELRAVLQQDAAHLEALGMLADLHYQDEQWAEAAETMIKRARLEKSRDALKDIFFKLGIIYGEKLPDPKRAVAALTRVVKADPNDLRALELLSNLFLKEWDWKGALDTTRRLSEIEPDKLRRIGHLQRVAKIYEEGFKDARHALEALRQALEIDPMHLPSIGELAKFFDRQSDVQSMRVHLDRTIARVRAQLDKDPYDQPAYHALVKIFGWRRSPDRAVMAAGVLDWLGVADAEEKAILSKAAGRDPYPGSALADPTLDETLFDARLVPAGFRHLFRLLDEPLAKGFRADVKRLGVGRNEKLPRSGHGVRDVANRLASDLGVRDFDIYVTQAHPTALMIELTEPPSLVIGAKLIEGAHELEVRFLVGRLLKMMQCHLALPMRLSADDLGVLVGAIVRQFVPDFVPTGFDERQVVAEAARMAKVIPKKMQSELLPFALECASAQLDLKQIGPSLVHSSNRAGLLACGSPGPAASALKRLGDESQLRTLLRFTVSEELAELRRQAGISVG